MESRAISRGAFATLVHGLRIAPEFREGLGFTLLLALVSTGGRVVVPVAVQQTIDRGLNAPGGPNLGLVRNACLLAGVAVLITAVANFGMNVRLYRTTENGLAALRVNAFRRVHDLSMLHQAAERRGSLVSRVTSDVDTISSFMQFGGLLVVISAAQVLLTTAIMLFWSWQLTLLVYACFLPLVLAIRVFQRKLESAYGAVRETIGRMLGAVAESVVGASVIRAYGVQGRTAERIDVAINDTMRTQKRAQALSAATILRRRDHSRRRQRRGHLRGRAARRRWAPDHGPPRRLPVPGDAVRAAGADRDRGAQRGAERRRRPAPRPRGAGHAHRRRRPG